jgi:hypothetical protein
MVMGFRPHTEYPTDPRITLPEGMVAISEAVEEDGHLVQYFAVPGSGFYYSDDGELDLGLRPE